jgi:hypothetical protein
LYGSAAQAPRDQSTTWTLAVVAALLTHVILLAGVELLGVFDPPAQRPESHESIDIVFSTPAPATDRADESDEPSQFSELPEDRADLAPDDPDFLSNVDSRARDRAIADSESDLPRMEGESEAPHVALEEPAAGAPAAAAAGEDGNLAEQGIRTEGGDDASQDHADPDPASRSREGASLQEVLRDRDGGRTGQTADGAGGRSGRPGSGDDEVIREAEGQEPRYSLRANGSAYFQDEMNTPGGNVSLFGDISLNTLNWDFAPWIQRFIRDYHRNWLPPYAYWSLGLISGYQLVDIEVAPDGRVLKLEVLEEEGHEALRESTLTTFRAFAPYHPLPGNFPEPTLKLRVKVIYPRRR